LKIKKPHILFIAFFVFGLSGCKYSIQLKKNEYLLGKQDFKGNQKILTETLENIIPPTQKENKRPLNLPVTPKVYWYNFGKNNFNKELNTKKLEEFKSKLENLGGDFLSQSIERKKQILNRKINRKEENLKQSVAWFWRNVGEPQVVISDEMANETAKKIEKFLKDQGFLDAKITPKIQAISNSNKVKLTYFVEENEPYIIDSVIYKIYDPQIDSLLSKNLEKAAVKAGDYFDKKLVDAEKNRIEYLLKDNGYYYFAQQYIIHGATNATNDKVKFHKEKHGNLLFEIKNPKGQDLHQVFTIKDIIIKAFDPNSNPSKISPDTLIYKNIKFITLDNRIPLSIIDRKIINRPNSLFKISELIETQRQFGLFNQFAFVSPQISNSSDNQLKIEYFAPLLEKYTFTMNPGVNHILNNGSNFFGFGIPVSLSVRNLLRRMEIFESSVRLSYEGQPSPLSTQIRGSLEAGINSSFIFPTLLFLEKPLEKYLNKNPKTQFGLGFNYSTPYWGDRLNFKLNSNYSWQPNRYTTISFSVLDFNLVNTNYSRSAEGQKFYETLIAQQELGNNLKITFDPQFVSSIYSTYLFNNQDLQKPYASSKFLKLFFESGGTSLNFAKGREQIKIIENIFPLKKDFNSPDSVRKYFQFIKVNADLRRYVNLTKSSSIAYRFNVGVTNPYGKNRALPYEKNFFAGGSSSIRAWSPRSLGVGSAYPDTTVDGNFIPQPGDILLESSFEYRTKVARFIGDIQFAAFVDAGNVWKWYNVNTPTKVDKANFELNRFFKEIAVGTGVGLRLDLSYFLFRLDWGIKVIDPSKPAKERFVLDDFTLRRKQAYGVQWNFGIGYPF
jgi:outer membrane protein insertion porin family